MAQLTLLTMNCLGLPVPMPGLRTRLRALGAALAAMGADVTCLQEVGQWRHLALLRHDEALWPCIAAQEYPYAPKGGLVTLARLDLLEQDYCAFRERGRAASLHATERYQGKGFLRTTFVREGRTVVVFNTHLSANYNATWSYSNTYARVERAQLQELAAAVRAVPRDVLVVVAGDFNVPRGSWLYEEFVAATGVIDPLAGSAEPTYRPFVGFPARAAQALDHVLLRVPHDLTVQTEAELCFRQPVTLARGTVGYLSDHLGVCVRLGWASVSPTRDLPALPGEPAPLMLPL
jgi:endonuclease/exonuclease/phosphatase family metal-dependent hydrolase